MIFISDSQGTITAVLPSPLNQGANNVNTVVLIAPFPASNIVSVAFTLPNGQLISPRISENGGGYSMTNLPAFSNKFSDDDGKAYNAWSMELEYPLLTFSGDITVQFFVSSPYGTLSTNLSTFPVQRGNPVLPTNPPSESQWQLILQAISVAKQAADAAENSATLSQESASSAASSAAAAESAKNDAESAKTDAESAESNINTLISEAGLKPTTGLQYTLLAGSGYAVGIGTATDDNIVIPATYNGIPVVAIASNGFDGARIKSVFIPRTVQNIGIRAFQNCTLLERVIIPSSVTVVGEYAFYGCSALSAVRLGDYFPLGGPVLWDEGTPQLAAPYIYLIGDTLYINDASEDATSFDILADGNVVATI